MDGWFGQNTALNVIYDVNNDITVLLVLNRNKCAKIVKPLATCKNHTLYFRFVISKQISRIL